MSQSALGQETSKRFHNLAAEAHRREGEALRLFRPMETQMPFLLSEASERIIRGGNRSGKTVLATAEVASAATGIPLTGPDGKELPFRFPTDRPLTIWIIGYDQKHIARIYKFLFTTGIFKKFRIIKDRDTGLMRSWRPWEPEDAAREKETKPHPPMIPKRFCPLDKPPSSEGPGIAFESKGEQIFSLARLSNGTEIYAFPSGGIAGQGVAVDLIWIDEDIQYPQHVQEWQARRADVQGKIIWSAWPWADNNALALMSRRAEEDARMEKPDITEIVLEFSKNPYMPKESVRKLRKAWRAEGENVLRARDRGEFLTGLSLVFPSFDLDLHGVPCQEREKDQLDKVLSRTNWRVPDDWTHYLGIDPGYAHIGIIFAAIPPTQFGDYFVVYDEIYAERATPEDMVKELKKKMGQRKFHAFVMDARFGRQTQTSGITTAQQWAQAFDAGGLRSRLTDTGFIPGSDDIFARNMIVRKWLQPRQDGTTKFRIFRDTTQYTQHEFISYKRKVTRDDITDKIKDKDNHLMDALAYLAASDPVFYLPPPEERSKDPCILAMEELQRRGKKKQDSETIYLGAGAAPEFPDSF